MSDYKNRLHVAAEIVDPIVKTVSVYPVKDAYLTQQEPVSPHGIQRFLFVNQSKPEDQMGDKIIMAFDVPKLTDPQYENIVSVELILQAPKIPGHNRTFDIKYHEDNNWVEDGTTWLGQPIDGNEVIKSKTLGATQKTLIYDITDIYKSHNNEDFHFPITILERDTGITDSPYQFLSRESGTKTSPVININYAYFAANMDANKIDGKVTVRRTVPNAQEPAPDIPGTVEVWGGVIYEHLDGIIRPRTHYADLNDDVELPYSGDTEDSIHEHAGDLPGIINVRKNMYSFLPGIINVRKTVDNELDGRVDINLYITRPGSPGIDDPPAPLPSDGRWVQPLPTPYLPGVIRPKTRRAFLKKGAPLPSPLDTESEIFVPASFLDGYVNVCGHAELPGTVTVARNVPNDQEPAPDLDGTLGIHNYWADDGQDDTEDKINKHVPSHNLNGIIRPRTHYADLNDDVELPYSGDTEDSIHEHAGDVNCTVNVRRTEQDQGLKGEVCIREYLTADQINGPAEVGPDLDGHVIVNTDAKKYLPPKDLEGVINITDQANLNGIIQLKTYIMDDEPNNPEKPSDIHGPSAKLDGIVKIIGHRDDDLEARVIIPVKADLEGFVQTRHRDVSDLKGKIYIDDASSGAYAFIIE